VLIHTAEGHLPFPLVFQAAPRRSGPACALAAAHAVAGVALHSPVASGLRALTGDWRGACSPVRVFVRVDPFHSAALGVRMRCHVFVGTQTECSVGETPPPSPLIC